MALDQLTGYEAAVAAAQAAVPEVRVLLGMECDIDVGLFAWYQDAFLARGYAFLLGSCHYVTRDDRVVSAFEHCDTTATLRDLATRTVAAIESGLFMCIAHPDVFAQVRPSSSVWLGLDADSIALCRDGARKREAAKKWRFAAGWWKAQDHVLAWQSRRQRPMVRALHRQREDVR